MGRAKITLDSAGIGEFLRGDAVTAMIGEVTDQVAAGARGSGDVETSQITTDRAAGRVFVSPSSEQAEKGVLTRAAAGVGLEIKDRR